MRKRMAQYAAWRELRRLVPGAGPRPDRRGWAVAPDLLLHLVRTVRERRPALVVELGSGVSTCWLALALRAFDVPGRLVSLEHQAPYALRTRAQVRAAGVADLAEVRAAPLTEVEFDGERWPWYARTAWADLTGCELLVVDGPPGTTGPLARYPAVPLLGERLAPGAAVVLDDYDRADEREAVARWRRRYPAWSFRAVPHAKGTALFQLPRY
ncbi:class I SAM-dependent methyltransferase [Streptomyces sp. NPDC050617]|uniref:class I SAM-dependent methyltransferase n=1 Tax=Streptomyces sp. NPDC050617 TaxID=3154628 RepID=UPI00341483F8